MSATKSVLVTGATGKQGGAVARALLAKGYPVRAFVRDKDGPAAKALGALGAELVVGDYDEPRSLRAAVQDAYGVFCAQPGDVPDPSPEVNARRGRAVVDAAASAGVAHLVYSSAGTVGRRSGVAHFEVMAEVEARIEVTGVPATVLRPVFFMDNWSYLMPEPRPEADGGERVAAVALDEDTPLQMISTSDIGLIAADVFDHPLDFLDAKLEIAADVLTVRQIAEVFTAVDGIPTRIIRRPLHELREPAPPVADLFAWLNETGFRADLDTLRRRWPDLLTLEAWLRRG